MVSRHWLVDDVEEVVCPAVADEAKLSLEVGDCLLEAAVGLEVARKAVVFSVEFEDGQRVVDDRLELRSVAHDACVAKQALHVVLSKLGN